MIPQAALGAPTVETEETAACFRGIQAEPLGKGETILLVEDADPLRVMTREILERSGYSVLEAENGERALEIAEGYKGSIGLLVTDVSLPKINGLLLAAHLQKQRSGLKVLYVSGYAPGVLASVGLKQGTAFLQKPFSAEELTQRVRELLGANR